SSPAPAQQRRAGRVMRAPRAGAELQEPRRGDVEARLDGGIARLERREVGGAADLIARRSFAKPESDPAIGRAEVAARHRLDRVRPFGVIAARGEQPVAVVLAQRCRVDARRRREVEPPVAERGLQSRTESLEELKSESRPWIEPRAWRIARIELQVALRADARIELHSDLIV